MSASNVVLVAGVHGVSGRAAAQQWSNVPDTRVYGLSRRSAALPAHVVSILADLLDRAALRKGLSELKNVTHVVFGAFMEKAGALEKTEVNVVMLENLMEVVESTFSSLRHVTIYQGGKAYGADL